MNRAALTGLLRRVKGAGPDGDGFRFTDDHEVTFYLGEPGQAMAVRLVTRCDLLEEHVELTTRDPDLTWYTPYASVHAVTARPSKEGSARRAGF